MKEKIIKLIEDVLKVPAGTITEDTMIEDVEQWDSLAHVMIIGQLEEELGVSIPLDEAIELKGMRELLEIPVHSARITAACHLHGTLKMSLPNVYVHF